MGQKPVTNVATDKVSNQQTAAILVLGIVVVIVKQ